MIEALWDSRAKTKNRSRQHTSGRFSVRDQSQQYMIQFVLQVKYNVAKATSNPWAID
jgi:hypothetical protein